MELRLPASVDVLSLYAASMAGSLSGRAVGNKLSALKSWHIQQNMPWPSLVRLKHTVREMMTCIKSNLDLSNPLHACVGGRHNSTVGPNPFGGVPPTSRTQF